MKRKFEFEFEDLSPANGITFEYSDSSDEELNVDIENDVSTMYANRQAFLSLAKLFLKIALCDYPAGFHLHLKKDFDSDDIEVLRLILSESNSASTQ